MPLPRLPWSQRSNVSRQCEQLETATASFPILLFSQTLYEVKVIDKAREMLDDKNIVDET